MTDTPTCERNPSKFMQRLRLPPEVEQVLRAAPSCVFAVSRGQLNELAMGGAGADRFEVAYEASGQGRIVEGEVVRCKNGLAVNYTDAYMRRCDPKCMVVADERPTDRRRYSDAFSQPFSSLRQEILDWLESS